MLVDPQIKFFWDYHYVVLDIDELSLVFSLLKALFSVVFAAPLRFYQAQTFHSRNPLTLVIMEAILCIRMSAVA